MDNRIFPFNNSLWPAPLFFLYYTYMTFLFLFISIARRDFIPFFASNPGLASVEPTTPRSGATLFFFINTISLPSSPFTPAKFGM